MVSQAKTTVALDRKECYTRCRTIYLLRHDIDAEGHAWGGTVPNQGTLQHCYGIAM
jgi:hypothetical protein